MTIWPHILFCLYLTVFSDALLKAPERLTQPSLVGPVTKCFDDCAREYSPAVVVASYRACRHGCRFAQYSSTNLPADTSPPYHQCYAYCHTSYKDLANQEACIFSCRTSYHSDAAPLLPPSGQASLPQILHNHTTSSKCLGQLYETLDGAKCFANIRMWQFNYKTMKCEEFVYGGCPEIANMFETKVACEKECGAFALLHTGHHHQEQPHLPENLVTPPPCLSATYALYLQMGGLECDNFVQRYQFNYETGECEKFRYGGCIDVANMWETLTSCQTACSMFTMPPTTTTTMTTTTTTTLKASTQKGSHKNDDKKQDLPGNDGDSLLAASLMNRMATALSLPLILLYVFVNYH